VCAGPNGSGSCTWGLMPFLPSKVPCSKRFCCQIELLHFILRSTRKPRPDTRTHIHTICRCRAIVSFIVHFRHRPRCPSLLFLADSHTTEPPWNRFAGTTSMTMSARTSTPWRLATPNATNVTRVWTLPKRQRGHLCCAGWQAKSHFAPVTVGCLEG